MLQVSVVVMDLQKAMERYWNIFGIGPWDIYTFQPPAVTNTTKEHGIGILSGGQTPADSFAYMDTEKALGMPFEMNKRKADFKMPPPEATYPPSA